VVLVSDHAARDDVGSGFVESQNVLPTYSLLDVMVWGAGGVDLRMDALRYAAAVQVQIEQLLQRSDAYRSKRVKPTGSSELGMVHDARLRPPTGYEVTLVRRWLAGY